MSSVSRSTEQRMLISCRIGVLMAAAQARERVWYSFRR